MIGDKLKCNDWKTQEGFEVEIVSSAEWEPWEEGYKYFGIIRRTKEFPLNPPSEFPDTWVELFSYSGIMFDKVSREERIRLAGTEQWFDNWCQVREECLS